MVFRKYITKKKKLKVIIASFVTINLLKILPKKFTFICKSLLPFLKNKRDTTDIKDFLLKTPA